MNLARAHSEVSHPPSGEAAGGQLVLEDRFDQDRPRGRVTGSMSSSGHRRGGLDVESVLSIDNGALRIQPLIHAGWGRSLLSYGPFVAEPGLALAVFMTHGHNTSQSEPLSDSFRGRLHRWLVGPEMERSRERLLRWLASGRVLRTLRQFRWWYALSRPEQKDRLLDENFALGWSPTPTSTALDAGAGVVMHATGPENGELWVGARGATTPTIRGLQNVPVNYVVVLRHGGGVVYTGSVPDAHGFGSYPWLRPVGLITSPLEGEVHAVIHQSTLGQIGFRLDTRVHGVRVARLGGWESRFAGAHAADRLGDRRLAAGSLAEVGGRWRIEPLIAAEEAAAAGEAALLTPPNPNGLLRVRITALADGRFSLLWRWRDRTNHWMVEVSGTRARLIVRIGGEVDVLATAPLASLPEELVVLDDGSSIAVFGDGALLFDRRVDQRLADATGAGVQSVPPTILSDFEAHPRQVPIPKLLDQGPPPLPRGDEVVATDEFDLPSGDLDGRAASSGARWQRTFGQGRIVVEAPGRAAVQASVESPSRGRTLYTIPWQDEGFADLELGITPPGTARGQGEEGRSGLVLWQDPDNYLLVNIWLSDQYGGASISSFFRIRGFEDLYDAVWSNVGSRVFWGRPMRLRLACTGGLFAVSVGDEPVIVRRFTDVYPDCADLRIRRVGIATNWEWGEDTGSVFSKFTARRRG